MKKILSMAIVCIMLAAIVMIPVGAEQTNVDVSALKFAKAPTIDGTLSEDEWGAPTYVIKATEAADKENASEGVSDHNTYLSVKADIDGEFIDKFRNDFDYNLWLRWDDRYFYVAVQVNDPDGHHATETGGNIWANDAVQLRVDPQGPDSKQAATAADRGETFDWKTTEWDFAAGTSNSETDAFGGDGNPKVWNNAGKLINAGFALVGDMPSEYGPVSYDMQAKAAMKGVLFSATTDFDPDAEEDNLSCVTNYEIALPWSVIGGKLNGDDWKPETDTYLGMSLVVLNSGGDVWLTWGCGICGAQGYDARETCGGTNAVLVSTEEITPKDGYATTPAEEGVIDTSTTIHADYLETLEPGTHEVLFVTNRAEYTFDLEVLAADDTAEYENKEYKANGGGSAVWKKGDTEGLKIVAASYSEVISSVKINKRPIKLDERDDVQGYKEAGSVPVTPVNPGGNTTTPDTTAPVNNNAPANNTGRVERGGSSESGGFQWWIIPIIVVAVAAVGCGVFFFLKKKKK